MKFRNQFLKYKVHSAVEDEEAAGGGGGSPDGNPGESNGKDNLLSFDDIWQNPDTDEENPGNNNQQPNSPGTGTGEENSFNDHVAGIDFSQGIDTGSVMTAMQQGNTEDFGKALNTIGQNAYKQAMLDMNKVVNARLDKAKEDMQQSVSTAQATDKAVGKLNEALPYTSSPMYKPVADEVFSRLLRQKDMTVDKAIKKTGEYFNKMAKDISKLNPKAPSSRSGGGFGNVPDNTGDEGENQDWMEFLGASGN